MAATIFFSNPGIIFLKFFTLYLHPAGVRDYVPGERNLPPLI